MISNFLGSKIFRGRQQRGLAVVSEVGAASSSSFEGPASGAHSALPAPSSRTWSRGEVRGESAGPPTADGTLIDGAELAQSTGMLDAGREWGREIALAAGAAELPLPLLAMQQEATRRLEHSLRTQGNSIQATQHHANAVVLEDPRPLMSDIVRQAAVDADAHLAEVDVARRGHEEVLQRLEAELRYFRAAHKVEREPRQASHWSWNVVLALVILTAESAINSGFFINISEFGLVFAVLVALCFSASNLVVSALAGWTFGRMCLDARRGPRWAGWIGTVCFCGLAVAAHYALATLRFVASSEVVADAQTVDLGAAARQVLTNAALSAAAGDLATWALTGLGLLISAVCFAKGMLTFGETVPGYAALCARVATARAELLADLDAAIRHLKEEIFVPAESKVEAHARNYHAQHQAAQVIRTSLAAAVERQRVTTAAFEAAASYAQKVFAAGYREIAGPEAVVPAVMLKPVKLAPVDCPALATGDSATVVELTAQRSGEARAAGIQAREQLNAQYLHRLERLDQFRQRHAGADAAARSDAVPEGNRPEGSLRLAS